MRPFLRVGAIFTLKTSNRPFIKVRWRSAVELEGLLVLVFEPRKVRCGYFNGRSRLNN